MLWCLLDDGVDWLERRGRFDEGVSRARHEVPGQRIAGVTL
jgi:hypothetical protein